MNLEFELRRVYGVPRLYPICKASKALCAMTGTPTLADKNVGILMDAGFNFTIKEPANNITPNK